MSDLSDKAKAVNLLTADNFFGKKMRRIPGKIRCRHKEKLLELLVPKQSPSGEANSVCSIVFCGRMRMQSVSTSSVVL